MQVPDRSSAASASDYDVVIVGGRLAGASLAARLGARGLTVLVVDKAEFPSAPEVPSCPIMYASAVALLDEIGFTEDLYAHAATRIHAGLVGFDGMFSARIRVPLTHGRDYLYGFERAGFDAALWKHLARFPKVTRRTRFSVSALVREGDRVVGIEGAVQGGEREQIRARLAVVGADGRHSLVARKAGAVVAEDRDKFTSTIHFAEWEGLAPATPDGAPMLHIVSTGRGRNVLFFPSRDGRVAVVTHVRSDRATTDGDPQRYYTNQLMALTTVRERLAGARQVSPLLGVRRIANRYRDVGGAGWLLAGDAVHHKDPVDGQGIYDALNGAKHLAELVSAHAEGSVTWAELVGRYRAAVRGETHAMFEATMERLERELYSEPPRWLINTLIRWSLQDPVYQQRFLLVLTRSISPTRWRTPQLLAGVVARGLLRDLRRTFGLRPRLA
jgi:2-polyprenyl-6-methoxyphenol hydroxylase-like FAD-dependent oxidoreductase